MHTHTKMILVLSILGKLADFLAEAALRPCDMVRQSCRVVHNTVRLLQTQKFVVVKRCNGCHKEELSFYYGKIVLKFRTLTCLSKRHRQT